MKKFIAKEKCWVVISNPCTPTLCELDEGQNFISGNEIVEVYYNEAAAHARIRQFNPAWKNNNFEDLLP